jgi:hypothetical protein
MPRNRDRQRANRKLYKQNGLALYNEYGVRDETPHMAVNNIIQKNKKERLENEKRKRNCY